MVSEREIQEIQTLQPDEQAVVLSLVKSFTMKKQSMNEAQQQLLSIRNRLVIENPMTMEAIDTAIHEGE